MGLPQKIVRLFRNASIDLRYGAWLGGALATRYALLGAFNPSNSDYSVLPAVFGDLIRPYDVLVDVGCGRGRVINWWLKGGHRNKIIGLELDPDLASRTARRLRRFHNVSVIVGDATVHVPPDGTLFYLYNPFNAEVMARFRDSIVARNRPATLIYYNCENLDVFTGDPRWQIRVIAEQGRINQFAVMQLRQSTARKSGADLRVVEEISQC